MQCEALAIVEREKKRWYPLRPHPVQQAVINDVALRKIIAAGRRSGKTELAKRHIVKSALTTDNGRFFVCAPTLEAAKRIYWSDLKDLSFIRTLGTKVKETTSELIFSNGARILLLGLDEPKRFDGALWHGGLIDEFADVKARAWYENVKPSLDTVTPDNPDYRAWAWLLGVPDGRNHFFDLAEYAKSSGDPDWRFYTWKSADILPPDVIASAKRTMPAQLYRQEYEAAFENATGRIYSDYSDKNATTELIQPHEALMWMHDFNYTPLSSAVGVRRGNDLYILDEVVLQSAVARQAALEFVERYANHGNKTLLLYGDPAGKAGEKHGQSSNYVEIEKVLRDYGWNVKRNVKAAAPAIKDRQNAVRAKIENAAGERSLFVNVGKCTYVHKGLGNVELKAGSTFQESDSPYQHITTAIGYCVDYEWPVTHNTQPVTYKPTFSSIKWEQRA